MTASNTKTTNNKVVRPVKSVHVVIFGCPNCGEEIEELKLCRECNSPMKVVQVIEKFGEDAEQYLETLKKDGIWDTDSVKPKKGDGLDDGGIGGDDLDDLDIPIRGLSEATVVEEDVEVGDLGDIFPDDSTPSNKEPDVDFQKALSALDEEEEDISKDMEELGADGLPEL